MSLCILDERWPFAYLQVYCDARVDADPDLVVDVMMAVGGRMSGQPLPDEARPVVQAMAKGRPGRDSLPSVLDVRAAAAAPAPKRSGGADHSNTYAFLWCLCIVYYLAQFLLTVQLGSGALPCVPPAVMAVTL